MVDYVRIRVISTVERYTRDLDDAARRHVPFAIARALTLTAKDAQAEVKQGLPGRFTLRNNWVMSGIRITPATKTHLEAAVGSREPFMARQETGGTKRSRGGHRIAVPKTKPAKVIPRGQRPSAMRSKPRVFMATTASGSGILRRLTKERYPVQILYWLKRDVKVLPRFGFRQTTSTTVMEAFGPRFVESLSKAMGDRGSPA